MRIIITDYASRERDIRSIRDQVFIQEQSVPRDEEFDDRDAQCLHAVVYSAGKPVGTGRLDLEKLGKIGRVAVLSSQRRLGAGTCLMQALQQRASEIGVSRLWCHAQLQAVPFYQQLGFTICSEEFQEANIPHVVMEKQLVPSVAMHRIP